MNGPEPLTPAPAAEAPALVFERVEKAYPGARALQGVSFTVPPGAVVGLVGANGSGKSTLLKLAAGLLRPTAGHVRVLGLPPGRSSKRRVAYMPEVDPLPGWMTGDEAVAFTRAFFPDWDAGREAELRQVLELPGHRRAGQLSKGQRTRLRLLLALARRAPLVLLDEPFSGVDPPSRARIARAILVALRQESPAQTVVLSTHDLKDAEPLFDRLLVLSAGRVALEGDAEDLRRQYGKPVEAIVEEVLS